MKVLLALDETSYSQKMLELVCKRKWAPDTEFKIVHVIEPLEVEGWVGIELAKRFQELNEQRCKYAEKLMKEARHKIENSVPGSIVHFEIRKGSPQKEIINAAIEWETNKILMGAYSGESQPHNFIGSVSRRVTEYAPCSVEVVRTQDHKTKELQASNA